MSGGRYFFLVGGTQTNAVVVDAMLQSYEGVVAVQTGHVINGHEAGAIEYTGHRCCRCPIIREKWMQRNCGRCWKASGRMKNHAHMVFPGMVYISHPTEYGTLYSKQELLALAAVCRQYQIPLYLDGARLGYGLMSQQTDVTLPLIAQCCDIFYIGGTKVGALCGEALVFTKDNMPKHFLTIVKQHGALLAKGRLAGIQFDTLFTDGLYFQISAHAIAMAELLKQGLARKGYSFYLDSPTNQQFVVLENAVLEQLQQKVRFGFWEKLDQQHTVVRFATSWATTEEAVQQLLDLLPETGPMV